jgi:8-oxo-dGTP pyrophosphatase MutT (NUDIX family)
MSVDHVMTQEDHRIPADAVVALIVLDGGRYLMQLRDGKRGIFYPGHWGLFGGAVDPGEDRLTALRRELMEELSFPIKQAEYFTCFDFDFSFAGYGRRFRVYYEVPMKAADLPRLELGEGTEMRAFTAAEILAPMRVVPYDAFALRMHANRSQFSAAPRSAPD